MAAKPITSMELKGRMRLEDDTILSINKVLEDGYKGTDVPIYVYPNSLGAGGFLHRGYIELVSKAYQAAGWSVEYTTDQREGDFFRFTPLS